MKTTIDLPDDLIRATKIRAAQTGRTVRELVTEYITAGLNGTISAPAAAPTAFPVIPTAADAPLASMTREQIIAYEHEALTSTDDADAR